MVHGQSQNRFSSLLSAAESSQHQTVATQIWPVPGKASWICPLLPHQSQQKKPETQTIREGDDVTHTGVLMEPEIMQVNAGEQGSIVDENLYTEGDGCAQAGVPLGAGAAR